MKKDKKINIDEKLNKQVELHCFFNELSKKEFIEGLIKKYFEYNPTPKKIEVTKDFGLKVTK